MPPAIDVESITRTTCRGCAEDASFALRGNDMHCQARSKQSMIGPAIAKLSAGDLGAG